MLRLFAPAKINMHLDILKKRDDGYHDLATIFQAVDWGDEILVEVDEASDADRLILQGPFADSVPDSAENFVLRAMEALRLRKRHIPPLFIRLQKNVPPESGLGGGSSDGAAMLMGLNEHLQLELTENELIRLAAEFGSDSPFFIAGGTQLGLGRGEQLKRIRRGRSFALLIGVPECRISTAQAFANLNAGDKGRKTDVESLAEWLRASSPHTAPPLHNAFQRWAMDEYPEVAAVWKELTRLGAQQVLLSGSGSACYGIFADTLEARQAAESWTIPVRALRVAHPFSGGAGRRP